MPHNRPHTLVVGLLVLFLLLGLLVVVFVANNQRQILRSRAQQPGPALVTGVPQGPPGPDSDTGELPPGPDGRPGPDLPGRPPQDTPQQCIPAVKKEFIDMVPCSGGEGPSTDAGGTASGFTLRSFRCADDSFHQGDGSCKSTQELMRDVIAVCGCVAQPTKPPVNPACVACDFDQDGECFDDQDFAELSKAILICTSQPASCPAGADTNRDGRYDQADVTFCMNIKSQVPPPGHPTMTPRVGEPTVTPSGACQTKSAGDCNCDGRTDLVDFECWRKEFSRFVRAGACGTHADFNGDAQCSLLDFEVLRGNMFR